MIFCSRSSSGNSMNTSEWSPLIMPSAPRAVTATPLTRKIQTRDTEILSSLYSYMIAPKHTVLSWSVQMDEAAILLMFPSFTTSLLNLFLSFVFFLCPRRLTFTWWGCCGLRFWYKPTELAHSFLFCFCVYFCLYGLSTVFHSINPPDNSPLSHSVLPVLLLPYWSFQLCISLWKSPSAHAT